MLSDNNLSAKYFFPLQLDIYDRSANDAFFEGCFDAEKNPELLDYVLDIFHRCRAYARTQKKRHILKMIVVVTKIWLRRLPVDADVVVAVAADVLPLFDLETENDDVRRRWSIPPL